MANFHPLLPLLRRPGIGLRAQAHEGLQVIHPQAHGQVVLGHQLPGQAPGHADIAVVVDDRTEDIPGGFHGQVPVPAKKTANCAGKCLWTKAWH